MLWNKSTKVFSETNNFFISTEKGIFRIMELYKTLNLDKLKIEIFWANNQTKEETILQKQGKGLVWQPVGTRICER